MRPFNVGEQDSITSDKGLNQQTWEHDKENERMLIHSVTCSQIIF